MSPKVRILLLGVGLACLAVGLAAFVAIRNDLSGRGARDAARPVSKFAADLGAELATVMPAKNPAANKSDIPEITAASCYQAGGSWNECGSLCRGKSADTVCAQVCVPQCECVVGGNKCPDGYACLSDVTSGEGVCRVGSAADSLRPGIVDFPRELRSADGVTTVAVEGMGSTGVYAPYLFNPFKFSGTTVAFENVVSWNVVQSDGKIVASGTAYVNSPDMGQPGGFSVKAFWDTIPTTVTGTLNVFEASAKDGSPIHAVAVPVELPTEKRKVYVYWGNSKKNPNADDCSLVYPVAHDVAGFRIKDTSAVEVALHELLRGPTKWEKSQGYYTSLPTGVADSTLTASGLEFSEDLQQGVGGSCRVAAIRAQINETYKRNTGTEENPIISIDGRTEDILQP